MHGELTEARNKGLHYRRTQHLPGFGLCRCAVCAEAFRQAIQSGEWPLTGTPVEGCLYVNREAIFANEWERENTSRSFYQRKLEALMVTRGLTTRRKHGAPGDGRSRVVHRVAFRITRRDRVVAATLMQWLGTNCGWCFLRTVMKRCGFVIVSQKDYDQLLQTSARSA